MRRINIESIKQKILESSVTRGNIFALLESIEFPETIIVDGKNRPTKNSNGKNIHSKIEYIENFWRWFGNSKVVDSQGRPLVVYHGTGKDFEKFNILAGTGKNHETGSFFTSSPSVASTYAPGVNSGNVMPCYLKMENPVIVDANKMNWNWLKGTSKISIPDRHTSGSSRIEDDELFRELSGEEPDNSPKMIKGKKTNLKKLFPGELEYADDVASTDDIARWAMKEGHRGVIFQTVKDQGPSGIFSTEESTKPTNVYVVFDEKMVKSVTGNNGQYSDSPNILTESISIKIIENDSDVTVDEVVT